MAELLKRGSRDEQLAALCGYARELLHADDIDGAQIVMDRAVRLDQRSPLAWTLRGETLARRNRAGEALGSFDRALDLDPKSVAAVVGKADLLLKIGSHAEAIELYEALVKATPSLAHVWLNLARAFDAIGRTPEAITAIDRAIETSDAPATWVLRGEIQQKARLFDDAKKSFDRAVETDPTTLDAWFHLAMVSAKLGDIEGAKRACYKYLDAAKEGDTRNAAVRSLLFQLDRHGSPQVSGVQQRRPAPPRRISSSRMRRISRAQKALEVPVSEPEPPPPDSNRQVAEVTDYEDTLADLIAADALYHAGRHVEALRKLEALVESAPNEASAWELRARVLVALDKADLAVQSIERALRLETRSANAWKLAARIHLDMKQPDRAAEGIERALAIAPSDVEAHRLRGEWLVANDRHTEAVYAFEKAVLYAPADAEIWLQLGRLLRILRRPQPAREALEKAADLAEAASNDELASEARGLLARLG